MKKPVIGICSALERAQWSVWDMQAALLPYNYIEAVQRAGAVAIMLPPDDEAEPDLLLDLIDGLMLAGGADIDPATYGEKADKNTEGTVPQRDRFEIGLIDAALKRDMPLLGICRGMQLLNVALGGTLRQHVPDDVGHQCHRAVIGTFQGADHDVRVNAQSALGQIVGETTHSIKSHHHQAIDRLGDGLIVTSWAAMDDLPESVELPDKRFVLGVQWHPEADTRSKVISALVAASKIAP